MGGWGVSLLGFGSILDALDGIQTSLSDSGVWVVGTNASYGAFVEFGTRNMDAQPYLMPAAREAQRDPAAYVAKHTQTSVGQLDSMEDLVKTVALAIERDASQRAPVDVGNLQASITAAPRGQFEGAAEDAIDDAPNPEALR